MKKVTGKTAGKITALTLAALMVIGLAACGLTDSGSVSYTSNSALTEAADNEITKAADSGTTSAADSTIARAADVEITAQETTESFNIVTEDGSYTADAEGKAVYTITSAGTYVLSGLLEGQILVDAGEDDEVIIELSGATVTYGEDSPIKIISAGKVEISAKKNTENVINDTRSVKTKDDDSQGEGAIYAKCDLKIKGSGTLVINASYNNGIHTTKDLTIQNLSLKVIAYNNAIKGNDSVTVKSGTVVAVSTNGDGIKTENTDANKKGVTRGDITICGGTVTVYAAGDGFQAAHDFEMIAGEDSTAATVTVYTGSYSSYTASNAKTTSYKGVKVQNELNIDAGSITINSYDDGLHADYGTLFEDGTKGQGKITISGGTVTISVYSPAGKTGGGRQGPGGWGGQQTVSGADGIHADNTLTISGGTVNIDSAYEGLEANHIVITGGTTYVTGNDDGLNASKKINETPTIEISGGYLDVTVPTNGDTDGIDSNGTYRQTGGIVITRGPNNQNMAAIDADSSISVTGGTLIVLGYGRVSTGGSVKTYSLSLHSAGSHTVKINGVAYTFTNASSYGRTTVYSDVTVSS